MRPQLLGKAFGGVKGVSRRFPSGWRRKIDLVPVGIARNPGHEERHADHGQKRDVLALHDAAPAAGPGDAVSSIIENLSQRSCTVAVWMFSRP